MRALRKILTLACFAMLTTAALSMAGQWGTPPAGWNDFKFGLVDGHLDPFQSALTAAVGAGIQIDYSYVYLTTPADITGFLFAPWFNYAKTRPGNVKPSITIYMLAGGADSEAAILANAASASFMAGYFKAVAQLADSCKGKNPIYVIEPDAWGYLLGRAGSYLDISDAQFSSVCHINDLGISGLSGFTNTIADLPMAIIKTLKTEDPGCYCGILASSWGFSAFTSSATGVTDAKNEGALLNKWLREPYRGDFITIEKNGSDGGSYGPTSVWMWTDAQNANYVTWCKTLGQTVNLPVYGWQISIGYQSESGYATLPNTAGRYQDTYFPYFFRHVSDFIGAGFIGYDAACNNQGSGTWYAMTSGVGDNGWFLDRLKVFNTSRPYNLNISSATAPPKVRQPTVRPFGAAVRGKTLVVTGAQQGTGMRLFDLRGTLVRQWSAQSSQTGLDVNGLLPGTYLVRSGGPGIPYDGVLVRIDR